jgi:hypothetical protein
MIDLLHTFAHTVFGIHWLCTLSQEGDVVKNIDPKSIPNTRPRIYAPKPYSARKPKPHKEARRVIEVDLNSTSDSFTINL